MGFSLSIRGSFLAFLFFLSPFLFLLGPLSLDAQTSITSNDGGTAVTGNLYEAVTFENGPSGGGSVTLDISGSNSVTLQQALPTFNPNVTFYGTLGMDMAISVIGENETESALNFHQNLGLDSGVTFGFTNDGTGGLGQLDSSMSAVGLSMGVSAALEVTGGALANSALIGSGTAGNASMVFSAFNLSSDGSLMNLTGGALFSTSGGISGNAAGGSASVSLGGLTLSGTGDNLVLTGGALTDNGSSTIGGNATGGNASVSVGGLALSGTGDNLNLTGGSLTASSGGTILGVSTGGGALVEYGGVNLTGTGNNLNLTGGAVDCGSNGTLLGGASGGSASVSVGGLTLSGAGNSVNVTGGLLDTGSSGVITGNGTGGSASVIVNSLGLSGTNDSLVVTGGEFNNLNGTDNGNVAGGSALVSAGALTLSGAGDNLSIMGGELTNSTGGPAVGGAASLAASSVTLGSGAKISLVGGVVVGTGEQGTAAVSIGNLTGSGIVTLGGSNASLQVDTGDFSGILEGGETLQKVNPGVLTLSGANSYSGGTSIALGTLIVDTGGALGTGGISNDSGLDYIDNALAGSNTIQNSGTLSFSNFASAGAASVTNLGYVYFNDNANAGSATIVNSTSGFLVFEANSSAQNATLLNANGAGSVVDFDGQSTAGNSTITNGTTDILSFNQSSSAGNAAITNLGLVAFSGTSGSPAATAGNATLANNGTVEFGAYSTAGNSLITTNAGATLLFEGGSTGGTASLTTNTGGFTDFSGEGSALVTVGSIAGSGTYSLGSCDLVEGADNAFTTVSGVIVDGGNGGSLTKIGAGALILTGNNTYTGGTLISDGEVRVDTGGTLGSGAVTDDGKLFFIDNATAESDRIFNPLGTLGFENNATAGAAVILNGGYMSFVDSSSAGNATITNDFSLGFDFTATAGNATITTNSGGHVYFFSASSGGTARFILNGTALLDISGETAGTPVTVGSIEGSGNVFLGGNNLTEGSNNLSTSLSGVIADGGNVPSPGGSLTKIGTGTLTLSGNNSYSGGTFLLNGSLLTGSTQALGTGAVSVSGGILGLVGPLDIGGNYAQTSGGTLQLEPGDRLSVTGTASLDGTLSLVSAGPVEFHDNETLTLLTSTGVSGSFNTVQDSLGAGVSVLYQTDNVLLEVFADAPSFTSLGLTPNQKAVGGALDSLAIQSADPALIDALDRQTDASLPGIYDQTSPANLTPIYRIGFTTAQGEAGIAGKRLSQLLGYSGLGPNDVSWNPNGAMFAGNLPAGTEAGMTGDLKPQRWGGFADGLGNFATVTSDGNGPGYQFATGGVVAGMDYRFSKDWAGGILLAYNQSSISQSTAAVNVTGGQAGLYSGWKSDGWHLDALAEGGINSYSTQRQAFGGTATGSAQGLQYSGSLSTGYDWKMDGLKWGPFLSGQYTRVNLNAFNEAGSLAPLQFGAQGETYLDSDLGVAASEKWDLGHMILSPSLNLGWEHLYQGNLDSLSASFGSGRNFTVKGPALGTNTALLALGLDARFDRGVGAFVQFRGLLGQTNYAERSLTGGVNIGF